MVNLRIAEPCHEDWSAMTPTARGRHCASCSKEVLDLTALPAHEARRRMGEVRERIATDADLHVCVRGEGDGRGRLLTPARRRLLTNAFTGMLAMAVAGCTGIGPELQKPQARHGQTGEQTVEPASAREAGGKTSTAEVPPGNEPIELPGIDPRTGDEITGLIEAVEPIPAAVPLMGEVCVPAPVMRVMGGVRAAEPEKPADPEGPQENG